MIQITATLSDELTFGLDTAAVQLGCSRTEVIQRAVEHYLEDLEDTTIALQVLDDTTDPVLDWEQVRNDLLRLD